jgi:predicted permease
MTPDDAQQQAERRVGDVGQTPARLEQIVRSRASEQRWTNWWSAFAQDLRYALRGLRLKPGFALAVVATLGLGIGANAAMFGIVDRLLFRPPNFLIAPDRGTRIYIVRTTDGKANTESFGYKRFTDIREGTTSFDAMTPFFRGTMAVGSGDETREMQVAMSSADLWKSFDIKPVIGRFFTASEDVPPSGAPVAVLSYAYWQVQFGGRNDVLGTKLDIGPAKYTIIGVAPEGFTGYGAAPSVAFIPISAGSSHMQNFRTPRESWNTTYYMRWFDVYARRKPGVSIERANADLTKAFTQSVIQEIQTNPRTTPITVSHPRAFAGPVLTDRGPDQSQESKVATWLIGVSGIVLLIACANVANLLLARALRRRREIAVRIALGVSRARLTTQLITESLLLAVLGGVAGLAIAQWGGAVMRSVILSQSAGDGTFNDVRTLAWVALLAAFAGLVTGLLPAVQAGRSDIAAALKAGVREGSVHRSRARVGLVVGQASLSVVLLAGAGLFVQSLRNVEHVRLGYDSDQLLWITLNFRGVTIDTAQQTALRQVLLERARTVPGVEQASRGLTVPLDANWSWRLRNLFVAGIDSNKLGSVPLQAGSPSLFATMGTRLIRGRGFTNDDRANAPKAMVVSEGMAKRLWPTEDAIGKCVRVGADTAPCMTVVGIAEDVRLASLTEPELQVYLPIDQLHVSPGGLFIRTRGPASAQVERVRRSLQQLMPGVSYVTVTPISKFIGSQTRSWRLGATMFTVFGVLALVLAAIGLYSVIAYSVTQRTQEMGVRIALGAQRQDVIRLIVRGGLAIVIPGVALGAIVALAAGRFVAPLLFNVSPNDPPVLISVVAMLVAVAVAASWIPAARAARVDPNQALRSE